GVIGAPSRCAVVALSPVGAAAPVGDNDFFRGGPMSPKTPVATGGAPVATGGRPRTAAGRVLGLDLEVDDLPGLGVHRVLGGEALGGQHPDLPLAVGGEEAEGALLTGHDLPDEVVGGVEQRSEEHTSELQSRENLVCRLLLEKKTPERHDPFDAADQPLCFSSPPEIFQCIWFAPSQKASPRALVTLFVAVVDVVVESVVVVEEIVDNFDYLVYYFGHCSFGKFFFLLPLPPNSTLFPYTTLFR